jgi:glutamate--cysteine ligase
VSWPRLRQDCVEVLLAPFPGGLGGGRRVGLENEYVVTTADGVMAPPGTIAALWRELAAQGWQLLRDVQRDTVVGARTGADVVTTDYGYATLELNIAPERTLHDAGRRLAALVATVAASLARHGGVLLGYGAQPVTGPAAGQLGPATRYPLLAAARTEELRGRDTTGDLLCLSASSQTQVDVTRAEAVDVLNALTATAGVRAALLANSSVWQGREGPELAARELFWDRWWPGRREQVGVPRRFHDAEHYVETLAGYRGLLIGRPEGSWLLADRPPFRELLVSRAAVRGLGPAGAGTLLRVVPGDLVSHSGIGWGAARLHLRHGTVEDRVACQQPPEAPLAAAALTLGLVERFRDVLALVDGRPWHRWQAFRQAACTYGLRARSGGIDGPAMAGELLAVARHGLRDRGHGEEALLEPLDERLESGRVPADEARDLLRTGGARALVARYDMRSAAGPAEVRPQLVTDGRGRV